MLSTSAAPAVEVSAAHRRPAQMTGRTGAVAADGVYGTVACCAGSQVVTLKLASELPKAREAMKEQPPQSIRDFVHRTHETPGGPPHMLAFSRWESGAVGPGHNVLAAARRRFGLFLNDIPLTPSPLP